MRGLNKNSDNCVKFYDSVRFRTAAIGYVVTVVEGTCFGVGTTFLGFF